jgi:hypothetical protein
MIEVKPMRARQGQGQARNESETLQENILIFSFDIEEYYESRLWLPSERLILAAPERESGILTLIW